MPRDPARVTGLIAFNMKWLDDVLSAVPDSEAGRDLRDPDNGFSIPEANRALAVFKTPEGHSRVTRQILNTVIVHELGHVVGTTTTETHRVMPPAHASCTIAGSLDTGGWSFSRHWGEAMPTSAFPQVASATFRPTATTKRNPSARRTANET
jgi:hypothetical protein